MTFVKMAAVGVLALLATAVCSAQQKFPLRSGEWTSTTPDPTGPNKPPYVMLFCLNDETWIKAFNNNPTCSLQDFTANSSGGSYTINCPSKSFQMKGAVKMSFDGMTHMTANVSLDMTVNGKVNHSESITDWRWKAAACDANADMNLRQHNLPR